jgi:hypothetical protein
MDLILLVLICCVIGFVVWLATTKISMPPGWASTIQVVALIALILFLLTKFVDIPNVLK